MLKNKAVAAYVGLALLFLEDEAHAQNAGAARQNLKAMITDPKFSGAITIAFAILAFWKWVEFCQNFKMESVLRDAATPAMLTFMAFSWQTVLTWLGILG